MMLQLLARLNAFAGTGSAQANVKSLFESLARGRTASTCVMNEMQSSSDGHGTHLSSIATLILDHI